MQRCHIPFFSSRVQRKTPNNKVSHGQASIKFRRPPPPMIILRLMTDFTTRPVKAGISYSREYNLPNVWLCGHNTYGGGNLWMGLQISIMVTISYARFSCRASCVSGVCQYCSSFILYLRYKASAYKKTAYTKIRLYLRRRALQITVEPIAQVN